MKEGNDVEVVDEAKGVNEVKVGDEVEELDRIEDEAEAIDGVVE